MSHAELREDPNYEAKGGGVRSLTGLFAGSVTRSAVLDAVIVTTLFLIACWQYLPAVESTAFHRDEARWVHRASYVRELANPFGSYWDEATWITQGGTLDERYRLRAQPPLGSYLMGLGLLVQGRDLDVNGFWNMDHDGDWNIQQGNMPSLADLEAARRTVAIMSAVAVVVVYVIGQRLTNLVGGAVAALFFCFHPLVALYASFAGSDMLLVALVALAAMAAYRLADRPSWPRAMLLGVLLGLGGAAKLSPLALTVPFGLLGAVVLVLHWWTRDAGGQAASWSRRAWRLLGDAPVRLGWQLISVPIVAGITFVASYPYLWRAPIEHTWALFEYRKTGMALQAMLWPHVAVETRIEALRRVSTRLGDELTVLGRTGLEIGRVELFLAGVGMALLVLMVVRNGVLSGPGLVLMVAGGQSAVTVMGMRVDWARYHLPILLFLALCIGVFAGHGWVGLRWLATATRHRFGRIPMWAGDV